MEIFEEKVYLFKFPYENTELAIPVRAQSREEAAEKLKKVVAGIQTDLAMEFPSMGAASPQTIPALPISESGVPALVLDLKIEELLRRLGSKAITDEGKAQTIKKWTELDFVPAHYEKIVEKLENLLNGKKEEGNS